MPDDVLSKNSSAPSQGISRAPFQIAAAPQSFGFGGRVLVGLLLGWSGAQERRHVVFVFPKRPGQRVEDFGPAGQWIQVRLIFAGKNAARDAQDFKAYVARNPYGRVDHPIAGQFRGFCVGPTERVSLQQALDRIEMDCRFVEAELDQIVKADVPDVGTASQNVAAQKTAYQQTIAKVLGAYGKAQTQAVAALNSIDAGLDQVTAVAAPVAMIQAVVNQALGAASRVAARINQITSATDVLNSYVDSFTITAVDVFATADAAKVARIEALSSTLDSVRDQAQVLEDALTTSSNPALLPIGGNAPAATAPAVEDVEILVDTCQTLYDALLAQLPPIATYIVTKTVGIIVLAQRLMIIFNISGREPEAYASSLLSLNRIATPQAIPAGTVLDVPTA